MIRRPPRSTLFPYTRSSDLEKMFPPQLLFVAIMLMPESFRDLTTSRHSTAAHTAPQLRDRKSTRLNSSHLGISYAVFCLKKKRTHKSDYVRKDRSTTEREIS